MDIRYNQLISSLQQTFINQNKFLFDKHVPEFEYDGKFLGDYFNQIAVEPRGEQPPRFYHTFSPFDVISNKAPDYAVVFENGELILNLDFHHYVVLRTAAMNAVVLKGLGINSLQDKRVLLFGAGAIATETIKILASELSLRAVDVITRSGDLSIIKNATNQCGVTINDGSLENISDYDVIICHTQSTASVIPENCINKIKKGAVITTFLSSTEHGEVADDFYNSNQANIIVDWDKTIATAKDMQRAQAAKLFSDADLIFIKDLLNSTAIDPTKQYTIYRSTGTPIQNLAVLKELLDGSDT